LKICGDSELETLFTRTLSPILLHPQGLRPGPVLIIPPDLTRIHSRAGALTGAVCRLLDAERRPLNESAGLSPLWRLGGILPALGTHRPLDAEEIERMFPGCPREKFISHRWRSDTVELGRLEAEWVEAAFTNAADTEARRNVPPSPASVRAGSGAFRMDWPVQVNRLLSGEKFSLIISIGQVVPHEVAGMANHAKNIFIGCGGAEGINKSHWLGALYGLERIMGRADNPVRGLFDEALRRYQDRLPPILWVLTVVDSEGSVRGLFSGFDRKCFEEAAALSAELNITRLEEPARKIVAALDPREYRSCWLGNKAVYRSRLALAPGGELVILAPAVDRFGEDPKIDALIRRHGYRGREAARKAAASDPDLARTLSAAAHLIHGSGEGRFTIRYCTGAKGGGFDCGNGLSREALEGAGYRWGDLGEAAARYVPDGVNIPNGWHTTADGEKFYFIGNPALGLWTVQPKK
jgi:nickel-dependent lactate racemase